MSNVMNFYMYRIGDRVVKTNYRNPELTKFGTVVGKVREKVYRSRYGLDTVFYTPGIYMIDTGNVIHWDGEDCDPTLSNGVTTTRLDKAKVKEFPNFVGKAKEFKRLIKASRPEYQEYNMVDEGIRKQRFKKEWVDVITKTPDLTPAALREKLSNSTFIKDIPDTIAWESDRIISKDPELRSRTTYEGLDAHLRVSKVLFNWIPKYTHTYMVSWYLDSTGEDAGIGSMYIHDYEIQDVVRGNLWKKHHQKPLDFKSLDEEKAFTYETGGATEIRNPRTKLYRWAKNEVIAALTLGIADDFISDLVIFADGTTTMYKFTDQNLSERVRFANMKSLGIEQ